jgi:hypothetical protein
MHFLIMLLFNAIAFSSDTSTFRSKVIGVLEGDTVEVLKDKAPVRIRLYGIDYRNTIRISGPGPSSLIRIKSSGRPLRLSRSRRTNTTG